MSKNQWAIGIDLGGSKIEVALVNSSGLLHDRLRVPTDSKQGYMVILKQIPPTHSYMQYLYKYPQEAFPYEHLLEENKKRSVLEDEFELLDTLTFDEGNYFDITITYAKIDQEDICILIEVKNQSKETAPITVLPTLWYRKQWSPDLIQGKPEINIQKNSEEVYYVCASHPFIGKYYFYFDQAEQLLFTENETNKEKIYGIANETPFVKDAFHTAVINDDFAIFKDKNKGTKFSPVCKMNIEPAGTARFRLRIFRKKNLQKPLGKDYDIAFLKRIFQKLTINFTWWVNQKDPEENYVFEGGFLGLDNIGVLDRNSIIQKGYILEQADGTAWMGMFATYMLEMAIEIAQYDDTFQDVALKYFEQYTLIAESLNTNGLWDEKQSFFYDVLKYPDGKKVPLKVRSMIGLTSIFATLYLPENVLNKLKQFKHGINWFRKFCKERDLYLAVIQKEEKEESDKLISLIYIEKLQKLLDALLDEEEFLSPYGIRSVSKKHTKSYEIEIDKQLYSLQYDPGESTTRVFGSNSNWRGPIWFPMNYLIIQSLKAYYQYFGDEFKVEFPSRSGNFLNLEEVAFQINARLQKIFIEDQNAKRPVHGRYKDFYQRAENNNLILFHEYFHGETGAGLGASHQTGWTGLVAVLIQEKNGKVKVDK